MRNRFSITRQLFGRTCSSTQLWRVVLAVLCVSPIAALAVQPTVAQSQFHLVNEPFPSPEASEPLSLSRDQALWAALAFEDADKVRATLDDGANPNAPDELSQMTPLMVAETQPVALILLERGADPRARDRTGRTALHHAVTMRDATKIIPLLVRRGADVDAHTNDGNRYTPLMVAVDNYIEVNDEKAKTGFALLIREFKHLGANFNAADARGSTPMAVAARRNQPDLIRLLIELGANPVQPLADGRTPLDYAREAGADDAVQILAAAADKAAQPN